MKSAFYLFSFLCLLSTFTDIFAQNIPLGTWRTHANYQAAQRIAITPEKVFCATSNGLFSLDRSDRSLETLSKISGLSENVVAQIAYHVPTQNLVIVFQNSNINLLKGSTLTEIALIRDANLTGSKNIHHIFFEGDIAYLSADFGVVVLDLRQQTVRETWLNLGQGGERLAINASTISQDSVLLASEEGILIASRQRNLLDFNNWKFFTPQSGLPNARPLGLVSRSGTVYAAFRQQGIYKYTHQGTWQALDLPNFSAINHLDLAQDNLLVSLQGQLWRINSSENVEVINNALFNQLRQSLQDNNGTLWLADSQNGLLGNPQGNFQAYFPNNPARPENQSVNFLNGKIVVSAGGFTPNYSPRNQPFGFYTFENGFWKNFNSFDTRFSENIPPLNDLVQATYSSRTQSYYFASFGQGVLVQNNEAAFEVLNLSTPNSTWQADAEGLLKISDVKADGRGAIWLAQHSVSAGQTSLHQINAEGIWQSYVPNFTAGRHPLGILIDFNQNKWLRLTPERGGGIWVFNEQGNRSRYLTTQVNEGNLPNQSINTITQDQNGQMWVGTNQGIAVFLNPNAVFEGAVNAITPIFELRPLLRAEVINAIAIDGGNRKWIATNNGLWLFSPDGSTLIQHFTTQNSPLGTNTVLDLSIDPQTGEVFVITAQGLLSYRGTATAGTSTHQNVKVFPNPVRPNFNGLVGISGLVANANVKITDISGRLFYETRAEGGTASWDLNDYNGVHAKAGIYLIFSSNFDGSETLVSKLAVLE